MGLGQPLTDFVVWLRHGCDAVLSGAEKRLTSDPVAWKELRLSYAQVSGTLDIDIRNVNETSTMYCR